MAQIDIKKILLSRIGIFFMLVLFIICLFLLMEWQVSTGRSGRYALSDNSDGRLAVEHFKKGENLLKQGSDYQAMEEFLEAEKYCNNIKNELLKGAINWNKGILYYNRLDLTNALNMFNLSKDSYLHCGRKGEAMNLYGKIAEIHIKDKNYEEAIFNYGKARAIAMELMEKERGFLKKGKMDSSLFRAYEVEALKYSTSLLGGYFGKELSSKETLDNLKEVYSRYNNGKVSEEDYLLLAYIYSYSGDVVSANKYISDYIKWRNLPDSGKPKLSGIEWAGIYMLKSDIAKYDKNYKDALYFRERYDAIVDSISNVERNQSIREIENGYWQKELTAQNEQVRINGRYMLIIYSLIILLVILVLFILVSGYRRRIEKKNKEIADYIESLKDMDERLSSAESGNAIILQQLDVQKEREKHLKDLLEDRFAEVRELVRTYYESGNSKKLQNKVEDLLKLQLSGDNFEVMEEVVNAKNDNIIKRVREKFPNIKEDNIKLLNLIYAGFSAQEISVILNDTPQNIYVRKSRLMKMISE